MIKQFYSILVIMALFSTVASSQDYRRGNNKKHERMKAKKIAYITDALDLTPSESEKFWPIYNESRKAFDALNAQRLEFDKLSEVSQSEAEAQLNSSIELDKKEIELKEQYNAKFLKCISAKKLVKLRGVERRFRREVLSTIRDRYRSRGERKG